MSLASIDPATGKVIHRYEEASPEEVLKDLAHMQKAFVGWSGLAFEERAACFRRLSAILKERTGSCAEIITAEMGKPITQSRAEVAKCAWVCDYYAENAALFLKSEAVTTEARKSYRAFEPLGIVLAIMPWNFPFWQFFRAAVPAMMAGNVMILKHASNVCGSALAIRDLFYLAGFPAGTFKAPLLSSARVSSLIQDPRVRGVTLTGSVPAGRMVAAEAGKYLKKTVLELGGSDPYLILEDADLAKAAEICATSRLINSGQTCISAKRFIVVESVRLKFEGLLIEAMKSRIVGDPREERTSIGPMARQDLRDELHGQVTDSIRQGAKLLLGGEIPKGPGAYYPATVLTAVKKGMRVFDEETFGPVAAIVSVKDERGAIQAANDTVFGLGAAVFTSDLERGRRIAEKELRAGLCFVNDLVKSDPRLSFGGVGESGYGRELGIFGIREFVNIKTVWIA